MIVSSELPDILPVLQELGAMVEETRGRPRININPNDLAALTSGRRVTRIHLAELYGCHPRTIRRRLLESGLSEPGPPVFTTERLRVRLNLSGQLGLELGLFFDHDAGVDSVGYDGLFAPSAR